jgi:hypothetical protein
MCLEGVANWIGWRADFGFIALDSGFGSLTDGIAFLDAVFSEGDLFADDDITLDAEVSELAALLERLVGLLFSGTAFRLLFVDLTNVWNGLLSQRLMSVEMQVSGSDGGRLTKILLAETNYLLFAFFTISDYRGSKAV